MAKCNLLFKILNIAMAALLVALALVRFINPKNGFSFNFYRHVLTVYFILFDVIIVLVEVDITIIIILFSFERYPVGKGLFFIFIGILCFDIKHLKSIVEKMDLSVALILIVYGVIVIVVGCKPEIYHPDNLPVNKGVIEGTKV